MTTTDQPRFDVPVVVRVRHHRGPRRTFPKLDRLLAESRFVPIRCSVERLAAAA